MIAASGVPVMPTILIVEDNELNRDMLSRRLERRGYDTLLAVDGEQGLEVARRIQPHLILMDMSLPVLDGWEATKRLKSSPETAAIPIVALTAHAMSGDRERALEAGCDEYDTKPVEFPRLVLKIEALLNEHRAK
jgi:two-component system, cell cycle response regulator DivK